MFRIQTFLRYFHRSPSPLLLKHHNLDNCLFLSLLYGVETWGNIECIEKDLRTMEHKALRAILRVKAGTTTDMLYNELKRADIMSKVKRLSIRILQESEKFYGRGCDGGSYLEIMQGHQYCTVLRRTPREQQRGEYHRTTRKNHKIKRLDDDILPEPSRYCQQTDHLQHLYERLTTTYNNAMETIEPQITSRTWSICCAYYSPGRTDMHSVQRVRRRIPCHLCMSDVSSPPYEV